MLSLGDTEVEYSSNFRLYLATEVSNPHFQADAAIKVNLINFTVTRRGLEEQLLGEVRDRSSKYTPDYLALAGPTACLD